MCSGRAAVMSSADLIAFIGEIVADELDDIAIRLR